MTCCRPFFFSLLFFASLFPSPPALCRYLLPLRVFVRETADVIFSALLCRCNSSCYLRVALSVQQQQLSSSCCFVRATGIICSSLRTGMFLQPFLSDLVASHSSEYLSFVFTFFFYGLACFVVFSYSVR